ncbi:hypothetical protein [Neorhodopirellula pilleata]|uniref:Uncharacterized protein n=1 Tax=Neorhodopirellula pilleata TaxID=2714738 RepID=A0A5C6ADX6_9BACT|nr:hypothetical protein [Neorhodopirellula pilleata]TWT97518.1 hypothetical protein Pla100_26720 [Neorhodopirellula pilleata]
MAKREADREDLFAEGVNLPQRGRLTGPNSQQWIIGWRCEDAMSLFVEQDPVFHFNTRGELRRAYVEGRKLAAEDGRLCELVRSDDTSSKLSLFRQILDPSQTNQVQVAIKQSLAEIRDHWFGEDIGLEVIGLSADDFRDKFFKWLAAHPGPYPIAKSPAVG